MIRWNPFGGAGASGGEPEDPVEFERAAIERDRDLAWELFDAQPTHRRIPELARSVLAREPSFTGMIILIALHHRARGELDEARRLLQDLLGRQDRQFLSALRLLRDLEYSDKRFAESQRLAEAVLREDPEADWMDRMVHASALVFTGGREAGWERMDAAVELSARTDPEHHASALAQRAARFLQMGAPPDRFLPAAEEAIAANPVEPVLSIALAYAYLFHYRAEEAEALFRRVLREDPTDEVAQGGMMMARGFLDPIERGDATMEVFRRAGMGEMAWRTMYEQVFDTGLEDALSALDRVLPRALVRVLRGGLRKSAVPQTLGEATLLAWHDGQDPGTGVAWGLDEPFRLMSSREIDEMEHAIERDPAAWPQWSAEDESFTLIATDDAGAYFFEGFAGRLYRRCAGQEDREVAPSLADWVWDRVVALGGEERRPGRV
ncbi:lipopolysaccharide assembly protein LapB [Leucobacter sp. wl10]|uniref:tetratricopeptide repeat protein n=1 Tax=Leucobacter sp. wl10 TaxID=2304677 RepID=UPI0013C361C7|nr:tetratricopeptide repeat protein [Leucobacter sp. wl10]